MAGPALSPNARGALLALAAMGLYATHDVIIKVLGASYAPFQVLFFAVLFSFPFVDMVLMHDASEANLRPRHPWWTVLRCGTTLVNGVCCFYAFSTVPLAEVYSILFMTPLLITILSIPLLGETVRLRRWAAVVTGLIGVAIVLQPGRVPLGLGHAAALAAACCSATSNVIVRKIGPDERNAVLMIYPMMTNFLAMGAILAFVYKPMPIEHIGAFAAMAALGTTAGLLFITAFKTGEATVVAPMQYSQILWATFYGYVFFGETLAPNVMVGATIIVASGVYIVLREGRSPASTKPVLTTMDIGRGRGTRPSSGIFARLRTAAK